MQEDSKSFKHKENQPKEESNFSQQQINVANQLCQVNQQQNVDKVEKFETVHCQSQQNTTGQFGQGKKTLKGQKFKKRINKSVREEQQLYKAAEKALKMINGSQISSIKKIHEPESEPAYQASQMLSQMQSLRNSIQSSNNVALIQHNTIQELRQQEENQEDQESERESQQQVSLQDEEHQEHQETFDNGIEDQANIYPANLQQKFEEILNGSVGIHLDSDEDQNNRNQYLDPGKKSFQQENQIIDEEDQAEIFISSHTASKSKSMKTRNQKIQSQVLRFTKQITDAHDSLEKDKEYAKVHRIHNFSLENNVEDLDILDDDEKQKDKNALTKRSPAANVLIIDETNDNMDEKQLEFGF